MGSRERAQQVLDGGASVDSVVNAGRDPLYRLRRLGDGAGHALVRPAESPAMATPYEIAKAGGKHSGLIKRYEGEPDRQIEKALRSLDRRIAEHLDKIRSPMDHVAEGISDQQVSYLVNSYWPKEVDGYRRESEVLRGLLKERRNGK